MTPSTPRLISLTSEAEQLAASIPLMERDSEQQRTDIYRWAAVGDEARRLILQAEEQRDAAALAILKAQVNGAGPADLWAKYRDTQWRLPHFGAPGPGDDPPPRLPLRDLLQ